MLFMPIGKFALLGEALRTEPAPLDEADLLRVHTPEYVAAVRGGEPRALGESQKFP